MEMKLNGLILKAVTINRMISGSTSRHFRMRRPLRASLSGI